jgi:hypothetical protein
VLYFSASRSLVHQFLLSLTGGHKGHYYVNLDDEVTRGAIVLHEGALLWPAPIKPPSPEAIAAAAAKEVKAAEERAQLAALAAAGPKSLYGETMRTSLTLSAGLLSLLGLGVVSPDASFVKMMTTFGLATIIGYQTVFGVVSERSGAGRGGAGRSDAEQHMASCAHHSSWLSGAVASLAADVGDKRDQRHDGRRWSHAYERWSAAQ